MTAITTKSAAETKKIAANLAGELSRASRHGRDARVVALSGELGAGKTTFAQGFAGTLGVKENVLSPTFVLMKVYNIPSNLQVQSSKFKHFVHIDCYRIASTKDLLHLGFKELLKDKDAIILIEWADRIKNAIPRDAIWIKFAHGAKSHQRVISISEY